MKAVLFVVIFVSSLFATELDSVKGLTKTVKIGILANRGTKVDYYEYEKMALALNSKTDKYYFKIVPIEFQSISDAIIDKDIEFVITNPSFYVELEYYYKISRIATLNGSFDKNFVLPKFGSVIFTTKENKFIKNSIDIKKAKVWAVDKNSFGGYIASWYELKKLYNIDISKNISFANTHDDVVYKIIENKNDIGIVRTDILERMQSEGKINIEDIKIFDKKSYDNFPFLCSTDLYPEWAFAKLPQTEQKLAEDLLVMLLSLTKEESSLIWTIPLDYSKIHDTHKFLKLPPYKIRYEVEDVVSEFRYSILFGLIAFLVILILLIKNIVANKKIHIFNTQLDILVKQKTAQLQVANSKMQELINTDELTKIASRRYFFEQVDKYFYLSKRQNNPLCILSLDIDHFKNVNDTYGHDIGDKVLRFFCDTIGKNLRKSDIFGRIGGEEFCICVLGTKDGAMILANKVRLEVENSLFVNDGIKIKITVSIGVSMIQSDDETIDSVIKRADTALYVSKNSGRNQVSFL